MNEEIQHLCSINSPVSQQRRLERKISNVQFIVFFCNFVVFIIIFCISYARKKGK